VVDVTAKLPTEKQCAVPHPGQAERSVQAGFRDLPRPKPYVYFEGLSLTDGTPQSRPSSRVIHIAVSRHIVIQCVVALRHEVGGVLELPVQGDLHPWVLPRRDGKRPSETVGPDGSAAGNVFEQSQVCSSVHRCDEPIDLLPGAYDWIAARPCANYDPVFVPSERFGEACRTRDGLDHHTACPGTAEGLDLLAGQAEMAPERFDATPFQ
jgi:hypothetical protein